MNLLVLGLLQKILSGSGNTVIDEQSIEIQIKACKTAEDLDRIVISYD